MSAIFFWAWIAVLTVLSITSETLGEILYVCIFNSWTYLCSGLLGVLNFHLTRRLRKSSGLELVAHVEASTVTLSSYLYQPCTVYQA